MVPSATAFVNGDSRGSKKRTYGSSDVSANRTRQLGVHLRRQRDAARAGDDEARRRGLHLQREQLAAQRQAAVDLTDALVAGEEIVGADLDVVARLVEGARAGRVELRAGPTAAPAGMVAVFSDSTGIRAPSALNE